MRYCNEKYEKNGEKNVKTSLVAIPRQKYLADIHLNS